nr:uncharacterized protein LOC109177999 [Ipomoea trifida]
MAGINPQSAGVAHTNLANKASGGNAGNAPSNGNAGLNRVASPVTDSVNRMGSGLRNKGVPSVLLAPGRHMAFGKASTVGNGSGFRGLSLPEKVGGPGASGSISARTEMGTEKSPQADINAQVSGNLNLAQGAGLGHANGDHRNHTLQSITPASSFTKSNDEAAQLGDAPNNQTAQSTTPMNSGKNANNEPSASRTLGSTDTYSVVNDGDEVFGTKRFKWVPKQNREQRLNNYNRQNSFRTGFARPVMEGEECKLEYLETEEEIFQLGTGNSPPSPSENLEEGTGLLNSHETEHAVVNDNQELEESHENEKESETSNHESENPQESEKGPEAANPGSKEMLGDKEPLNTAGMESDKESSDEDPEPFNEDDGQSNRDSAVENVFGTKDKVAASPGGDEFVGSQATEIQNGDGTTSEQVVFYKTITKIIAARMAGVLPDIVNPAQGAFVAGRSISDNIMLAQEIIRGYSRKRISPRCTIMVDIRKAFDSLIGTPVYLRVFRYHYSSYRGCGNVKSIRSDVPTVEEKRYLSPPYRGCGKGKSIRCAGASGLMASPLTLYLRLSGTLDYLAGGC